MLFQFRIQIKGIKRPPVWRRVVVPSTFTFERLHYVIQASFGWENCHLYCFCPRGTFPNPIIADPDEDDLQPVEDAGTMKLTEIFFKEGQPFRYVYDYGDSWEHDITLESISQENSLKAVCLAGKGTCPPEDCGGAIMYEEIKRVLNDEPKSADARYFRAWLNIKTYETWEEKRAFDIEKVNEALLLL